MLALQASAQFCVPTKEEANQFRERTLVVELQEITPAIQKAYKTKLKQNPKALDQLRREQTWYNSHVKKMFREHWKLHNDVVFKTTSQIQELVDAEDDRYAIFTSRINVERSLGSVADWYYMYGYAVFMCERARKKWKYKFWDMTASTSVKRGAYFFKLNTFFRPRYDFQLRFVIKQFQNAVANSIVHGKEGDFWKTKHFVPNTDLLRKKEVKEKTLMLPLSLCNANRTDIKAAYPHPYEPLPVSTEVETMQNATPGYLYLDLVWSDRSHDIAIVLIDSSTDEVVFSMKARKGYEALSKEDAAIDWSTDVLPTYERTRIAINITPERLGEIASKVE